MSSGKQKKRSRQPAAEKRRKSGSAHSTGIGTKNGKIPKRGALNGLNENLTILSHRGIPQNPIKVVSADKAVKSGTGLRGGVFRPRRTTERKMDSEVRPFPSGTIFPRGAWKRLKRENRRVFRPNRELPRFSGAPGGPDSISSRRPVTNCVK